MKLYALNTLVCPLSKTPLSLISLEQGKNELSNSDLERCEQLRIKPGDLTTTVKEGVLVCEANKTWYPIVNYVPLLIDYPTEIHHDFKSRHAAQCDALKTYALPGGTPRPGEQIVQKNFTKQWKTLPLGKISFGLSSQQRDDFIRLELDWPEGVKRPGKRILEVGCGSGFESLSLDRVTQGEIYGFDLNLAVLRNGPNLDPQPFINVAVASLYALPVRPQSFDIVYSSGVLHHTYSTKAGFDEIFKFKLPQGMIYIWVYASEDYCSNIKNRLTWVREDIFRPMLAKLPGFLQTPIMKYIAWRHCRYYKKVGGYNKDLWGFADSEHFIRDLWTPLYAHRQTFKEVIIWFQEKGLEYGLIDPQAYYERLKCPLIGIGIRGIPKKAAQASLAA